MIRMCLLVVLVGGCSIDHRSDAFTCATELDCAAGRTCADGFCVVIGSNIDASDAPAADAPPGSPDGAPSPDASTACPPECTSCATGTCNINCAAAGSCAAPVVCPAGWPCKVECGGLGACAMAIDCSQALSCRIECTNTDTCQGPITCGAGVCRVECGGDNSCTGGISCQDSCLCDTFCDGAGACSTAPTCPPPGQCTSGTNCTSSPGPCNTC